LKNSIEKEDCQTYLNWFHFYNFIIDFVNVQYLNIMNE
jgi:hypothetical protein